MEKKTEVRQAQRLIYVCILEVKGINVGMYTCISVCMENGMKDYSYLYEFVMYSFMYACMYLLCILVFMYVCM